MLCWLHRKLVYGLRGCFGLVLGDGCRQGWRVGLGRSVIG